MHMSNIVKPPVMIMFTVISCFYGSKISTCDTCVTWTATERSDIQLMCFPPSVWSLLLFQGSSAMSQILVQKLGALLHLSAFLKSPNRSLQKAAMSLLNNMSRNDSLQTPIGEECC